MHTNKLIAAGCTVAAAAALFTLAPAGASEAPDQDTDCHPGYDPCVPVADDVDCEGGEGDGPEYVAGPIEIIGDDEYGLDGNDDGVACEGDGDATTTTTAAPTTTTTAPPAEEEAPPSPEAPTAAPVQREPSYTG